MNTTKNRRKWHEESTSHAALLEDIERLGGENLTSATGNALADVEAAVAKTVAETPAIFDAGPDAESQKRAVERITRDMAEDYLRRLAGDLRKKSGYIRMFGMWIHRSIITYSVYILAAGFALTFFIPMILSPKSGAWWHGIVGLILTVAGGIWAIRKVHK